MALILGDDNPNHLNGTNEADIIIGFGGDDTLAGHLDDDLIYGNLGNDSIDGDAGDDTLYGGQGGDNISGGFGNDLIYGNFGNDTISADSGNDTIFGGQGDDSIAGNSGNDLIYGNLGNDQIEGQDGNDTVFGGHGNDVLSAGDGNDIIYGNFENDVLTGDAGNNTVYGGQGNDLIVELGGSTNSDHLFGNLGADTFDFSTGSQPQSGQTQATADHISDFSDAQGDRVNIATPPGGILYGEAQGDASVVSVEQAITFANSHDLFDSANVVFVAGVSDGYLLVDANSSGSFGSPADYAIVLDHLNSTTLFGPGDVI
jgi:Ca2+-binding RTX toxin-like protein